MFIYWRNDVYEIIDSDVGIWIGTIEITENTQQVLSVKSQTAKPLREHIPSRFPVARRTDYRTLWQSLYKVSWLKGWTLLKQLTVLLSKREVSNVFFVNQCITVSYSVSFIWILWLGGLCNTTKTVLDIDAVEIVYVE